MYKKYIKRLIDILISLVLLVILFPIILIVTLMLFLQNKGTPFFIQERPGQYEKIFSIIKFKTLSDEKNKQGELLPDNERLTKLGSFVRKTSIDEIPQLLNVLMGDMSLVGPRPLLFKYLPLYSREQKRRHDVKPGITGWAQVNGRNTITWTKKFEFDVYYVNNISFLLDLKIIWRTLGKVLKREGVNQSVERPMQPFTGKN